MTRRCRREGGRRVIRSLGALSLGLAGLGTAPAPTAAHSLNELEAALREREPSAQIVHQPAPPFALENLAGRQIRLSDYRGTVVVLYFVDAACKDDCALQSRKLLQIRQELAKTPMSDRVQFIPAKRPKAAGELAEHAAVTYLIDKTGNLRARYYGLKFNATNMILHLNALANDIH